jgi:hypothetical protein
MSERIDDFAKTVAEHMTRRSALQGVGALALGSLEIFGLGQETEAKNSNKSNECNTCKDTCKRNNKKKGKTNPNNCSNKCRSKCSNNNK